MALLERPYGPTAGNPSGLSSLALNTSGATPGPLPALQAIAVTTETQILNPAALSLPLSISIPPNTLNEQIPIDLIVAGYIKTGATMTVTGKVYSGGSSTIGSNTLLGTTGAVNQNTATSPFWIQGKLIYDSVSGKLTGTFKSFVNGTIVAEAAVSNTVTGVNNANNPVATFTVTFTFSVANAANLVNIQKFSVG